MEESRAREASNKVLQRLTQRMIEAEQSSEVCVEWVLVCVCGVGVSLCVWSGH